MLRLRFPMLFCLVGLIPLEGAFATVQRTSSRQGEVVFHESFPLGSDRTLHVDVADADVDIRTGAVSQVEVEVTLYARDMEWGREVFDRMEFRAEPSNGGVRVSAREPRMGRDGWSRDRWASVAVRVTIPLDFNVNVETMDGDIELGNLRGMVDLHTMDGDITVGDLSGSEVSIRTTDGDVRGGAITAEVVSVETTDGDLQLGPVAGRVIAETSDGDIDIELGDVVDVRLTTSDGDISISAPAEFGAELDLEGEDLSVPRGVVVRGRISRRSIRGTLNGGGPRIQARTHDGEIVFRRAR